MSTTNPTQPPFTKKDLMEGIPFKIKGTKTFLIGFYDSAAGIVLVQWFNRPLGNYCTIPVKTITDKTFIAHTTTIFFNNYECTVEFANLEHLEHE